MKNPYAWIDDEILHSIIAPKIRECCPGAEDASTIATRMSERYSTEEKPFECTAQQVGIWLKRLGWKFTPVLMHNGRDVRSHGQEPLIIPKGSVEIPTFAGIRRDAVANTAPPVHVKADNTPMMMEGLDATGPVAIPQGFQQP